MRSMKVFVFLLCLSGFCLPTLAASPVPAGNVPLAGSPSIRDLVMMKPGDVEKLTGKKMRFKDRVVLRLIRWKWLRVAPGEPTAKQLRQGRLSLIFGSIALVTLLLPYLQIISIPLAIAGLTLGILSLNGNSNTQGILGLVFSATTLFLVILFVVAVFTFFSEWW